MIHWPSRLLRHLALVVFVILFSDLLGRSGCSLKVLPDRPRPGDSVDRCVFCPLDQAFDCVDRVDYGVVWGPFFDHWWFFLLLLVTVRL